MKRVQLFFDQEAEHYSGFFEDQKTGATHSFRQRAAFIAAMTNGKCGRLLDCAIGSGEVTASALASGEFESATVIDFSQNMLRLAINNLAEQQTNTRIEFVHSDIFAWLANACEEADSSQKFDVILCIGLIAHTGRLPRLLSLLAKQLRPDGQILLQTTLANHPGTRIMRTLTARRYERNKGYAIAYYTEADIRAAVASAGLQIDDVRRFGLGVPFGDRISARANFFLEQKLEAFSRKNGSEAIFSLRLGGIVDSA